MGDLPKVERPLQVDDFLDKAQARALRDTIRAQREAEQDAQTALEQAQLQHRKAMSDNQAERETFNNWLATRRVTERADHDPEVLERTRKLDLLKQAERQALRAVEAQQQAALDARQTAAATQRQLSDLEADGYATACSKSAASWSCACSCTAWRSRCLCSWPQAGCLPKAPQHLLAVCGASSSLRCLPSSSSWCPTCPATAAMCAMWWALHHGAGGRYAILALNRYLERQKLAEAMPDAQRREELSYDVALARLGKTCALAASARWT